MNTLYISKNPYINGSYRQRFQRFRDSEEPLLSYFGGLDSGKLLDYYFKPIENYRSKNYIKRYSNPYYLDSAPVSDYGTNLENKILEINNRLMEPLRINQNPYLNKKLEEINKIERLIQNAKINQNKFSYPIEEKKEFIPLPPVEEKKEFIPLPPVEEKKEFIPLPPVEENKQINIQNKNINNIPSTKNWEEMGRYIGEKFGETVLGGAGGWLGRLAGASIGTAVGGPPGGISGGIIGGTLGGAAGEWAGSRLGAWGGERLGRLSEEAYEQVLPELRNFYNNLNKQLNYLF